jgi:cytochrome d ubiquinol oxidase subunit II
VAFVGSAAFLLGLLATAAASTYPVLLRSTLDPTYSLTSVNAASSSTSLGLALGWWVVGIPLVIGYFAYLFHRHAGPVAEHDHTY